MFWEYFWNLYSITFGSTQPCPKCYLWPSEDCGYLKKDWCSIFVCIAPDSNTLTECESCHHLICSKCQKEVTNEILA